MRMWKAFATKAEQKAFEAEKSAKNQDFRVCMRMTAKQLEKDLCGTVNLDGYNFVTVYTTDARR